MDYKLTGWILVTVAIAAIVIYSSLAAILYTF